MKNEATTSSSENNGAAPVESASRRDLFKQLGATAAYVAPATLVLLSSERANAY